MEHVEEEALRTSPHEVRCWKRYVDDNFCFLGRATVDTVLNHLNSLYPSIQFTVEQESGGKIPFLDTLVSRQEDGSLEYRKNTPRQVLVLLLQVTPPCPCEERGCSLPSTGGDYQ